MLEPLELMLFFFLIFFLIFYFCIDQLYSISKKEDRKDATTVVNYNYACCKCSKEKTLDETPVESSARIPLKASTKKSIETPTETPVKVYTETPKEASEISVKGNKADKLLAPTSSEKKIVNSIQIKNDIVDNRTKYHHIPNENLLKLSEDVTSEYQNQKENSHESIVQEEIPNDLQNAIVESTNDSSETASKKKIRRLTKQELSDVFYLINVKKLRYNEAAKILNIHSSVLYYWSKKYSKDISNSSNDFSISKINMSFTDSKSTFVEKPIQTEARISNSNITQKPKDYCSDTKGLMGISSYNSNDDTEFPTENSDLTHFHRSNSEISSATYSWTQKFMKLGMDFKTNCVFIGETDFKIHKNLREESGPVHCKYMAAFSAEYTISTEYVKLENNIIGWKALNPNYFEDFVLRTLNALQTADPDRKMRFIVFSCGAHILTSIENIISYAEYTPFHCDKFNPVSHLWHILRSRTDSLRRKSKIPEDKILTIAYSKINLRHLGSFVKKSIMEIEHSLSKFPSEYLYP